MSEKDKNDQVELDLDDNSTDKDDIEVVAAEKDEKSASPLEDGIQDLKLKLEQERLARADAERRARDAAEREASAKNEVDQTNLQLVTNAIDTVRRNNDILKMNYSEAMSIGDYNKAAEIQETMGSNSAKLLQLENGRQAMEAKPRVQAESYAPTLDPVEKLASQLSVRSAAWVRQHPEFATDQRLFQKMIAAHNLAIADGLPPDSDDYFASVEGSLRINQRAPVSASDDPMTSAAKATQSRNSSPPPAAPVSRSPSGRPNVVRLTSEEREMAQMMGMTEKDYAVNKVALQKEGKLN
jgi:hypothetical protein